MDRTLFLLVLGVIAGINCHCPHEDQTLVKWSDHVNTWGNTPPTTDGNITIDKAILLDEEPPTLWSIHITSSGKLVWDPNTEVHLKVHWVQVDGELHIGAGHCPFEQNTRITFLGNVEENDLGAGGDKALFVTSGGTLEIHGKPKVSWTKLAQTAPKFDDEADTVAQQVDLGPDNDVRGRGLIVYNINPTSGSVDDAQYFRTNIKETNVPQTVLSFLNFINDIPDGNVVAIGVKKELVRNGDLSQMLEGIEILAGQTSGDSPLRSNDPANYVLITIKGSPEKSVESYSKWNPNGKAEADFFVGQYFINLISETSSGGKMGSCRLFIAKEDKIRPVLTMIEDVSSWQPGDKVVIASTDYNWRQAEDMTLAYCDTCTPYQIKLSAPLRFTHFGEIYKNVDMRGEIGLLTRNILFDSEDAEGSTTYGGNLKVLKDFKSVHIENAEFNDLGQEEVLGRYPIHFHMCEDVDQDEATRPWIKHNSIHHSNSRCVTIHGTHGLIVEDNVCYMTRGHGYFLEDGGEKRTVLDGNLGLGQERGILIKADSRPSTFWITNPLVHVRNNVAAGGEGRGYWFTYPQEPLPPSKDKGFMQKNEARHTAITEFYNNAAHSNKNHGFFVDNEFLPDTSAKGYNRYRPKADPIMHLKYGNSTDVPAVFDRMTAYKNSPRNAWLRGGTLKITRASLSDSGSLMTIIKENSALQFVERSVFIGDSPNLGQTSIVNGEPISIGRSLPLGRRSEYRKGISIRKGPIYMTDNFFDDFSNNEYYKQGAIGISDINKQSPLHSVKNALFGFSDPTEGNRVLIKPVDETESTKDDERTFRDTDYSVTEVEGYDGVVTLLGVYPLQLTEDACKIRTNWNFAYCKHAYGLVNVAFADADNDNVVTFTRDDDYINARADRDSDNGASFLAILKEEYSYSMFWENEVPDTVMISGRGISKTDNVRIGMCIPPNAEFDMKGWYPTAIGWTSWTRVASINDVTDQAQYFYDADTGYLAFLLLADGEFEPGHLGHCPVDGDKKGCPKVRVRITNGDLLQTDCLDAAHQSLSLASSSASKRRLNRLLDILTSRLMSNRLHKRSAEGDMIDSRILDATAIDPPATWGAGATR